MSGNRYVSPFSQDFDSSGNLLASATLTFYLTGTTTLTNVYTTTALAVAASNPQTLDSSGRATQELFLDPDVTYKVVLKDSTGATIATRDPVVDHASLAVAKFEAYAGNPNGNVAGTAATPGTVLADVTWDTTNNIIWVCTTSGTAAAAVWTDASGLLTGTVAFSGVISPTSLAASQNNYNPTSLSTSSVIRQNQGAAYSITGLAGGASGRVIVIHNISAYNLTLTNQSASSTAANRFLFGYDVVLGPDTTAVIQYDATTARWRGLAYPHIGKQSAWIPGAAMWKRSTNGPAAVNRELATGGDVQIVGWGFDTTTEEAAQFYVAFPNSWDLGTVTAKFFWTNQSGLATETVDWGMSAGAYTDADLIDTTDLGTEITTTDTYQDQNALHV